LFGHWNRFICSTYARLWEQRNRYTHIIVYPSSESIASQRKKKMVISERWWPALPKFPSWLHLSANLSTSLR
jgi:hypothetical protein